MEFLRINKDNYNELYSRLKLISSYKRSKIKITYICQNCKKEKTNSAEILFKNPFGFENLICGNCRQSHALKAHIDNNKEEWVSRWENAIKSKYGVDNVAHLEEIQENKKKTCLEKYGSEYAIGSETVRNKINKSFEEKFGGFSPFCSSEIQEKAAATQKLNHDGLYGCQTPESQRKRAETCMKRYGKPYADSEEIREKARQTCLERYGVESTFNRPEFPEKRRNTMLEKYGVEYSTQDPVWRENIENKYYFSTGRKGVQKGYSIDGYNFDSSWELILYIWLRDNNIEFEIHPKCDITYTEKDGSIHNYRPDFKIKDQYVEVKGNQFFNKEGYPISIYGEDWSCKFNCIVENNIKLYKKADLKEQFYYVKLKYGNSFIKDHRNKKI